ncbi:MAG: hypothetical protein H0X03_05375 [Nitrosopumilus sp.]|nr:hypothetical protein [Nitrosopumilus sp.]
MSSAIDWPATIKKEARGLNGEDLGEVQEVTDIYIITEKGIIDKVFYSIPKDLVKDFDGATIRFKITEEEANNRFLKDKPNST